MRCPHVHYFAFFDFSKRYKRQTNSANNAYYYEALAVADNGRLQRNRSLPNLRSQLLGFGGGGALRQKTLYEATEAVVGFGITEI